MNRSIPPSLHPIKSANLIFPNRIELVNDIDLYWLDEVKDNTVKIDIVWNAGSKLQHKALISSFCNQLLFSGNTTQSANDISEQIDALGGYLSHEHNFDHGGFTIFGLNHHINSIFDIVKNAFDNVQFPQDEIDKLIPIKRKQFEHGLEKVNTNARRLFLEKTFGLSHPYGKLAQYDDFDLITQEDLMTHYSTYYQTKPTIFVVGKMNDELIATLNAWVAKFESAPHIFKSKPINQSKGAVYQSKENAIQTAIRIGKPAIKKNHPDYFHFQVLNTILGGYFGSRLMSNIREDKGYTYGIGSGLAVLEEAAYFFIATEVAKAKKDDTIREIYYEINRLKTNMISENELAKVKNYLLGEFLRNADGPIAMMEKFKNIYFNDLSESYYSDFINSVSDCTPKRIKALAETYFERTSFTEISFG